MKAKIALTLASLLGLSCISGFRTGRPESLQQAWYLSPHHLLSAWLHSDAQALQSFAMLRIDRIGIFTQPALALAVALEALLMLWFLLRRQ